MVVLVPTTTSVTAPETARLFMRHVFVHYGLPRVIVSDRDSKFVSAFWKASFKDLGTRLAYSSAYHPQSDGQTERVNRSMEQVLRGMCLQYGGEWEAHLPMAQFALNAAEHVSTGFAPFKLMYGYEPLVPATLQSPPGKPGSKVQAAADMVTQLAADLRRAQRNMRRAQRWQQKQANRHRRDHVYAVGDMVMLSTTHLSEFDVPGKKLLQKYVGPFPVVQVVNPVAVKLQLPASLSRIHPVFHVSLLKPAPADAQGWHAADTPAATAATPPLPVPVLPAAPAKKADAILQHDVHYSRKLKGPFRVYLVKWAGLPLWDASWVDEPELLALDPTAGELLAKYVKVYCPVWGVDTHLAHALSSSDEE
jgi:hypothetical protein